MATENIPLWFSYASEQHPLVCQLCELFKPGVVEVVVELAKVGIDDKVHHARFVPLRYRLDGDDDTQARYRLKPGDPIFNLVYDIASNPLKVMVLSESYFQSQHCLNELCLSLCFINDSSNKLPLLIFADLVPEADFFAKHMVMLTDSEDLGQPESKSETKSKTLLQALIATHENLSKNKALWRSFDLTPQFREDLPELLSDYSKVLYSFVKADDVSATAVDIYRYGFSYLKCLELDDHRKLLAKLYYDWCGSEFAKKLLEKINLDAQGKPSTTDHFLQIRTIGQAQEYCSLVHRTLDKNRSLLNMQQSQQVVFQLYTLVVLQYLKPIGAALLTSLNQVESFIDVYVERDDGLDFKNSLLATLSFCTAKGFKPRMDEQIAGGAIDEYVMTGMIPALKYTIKDPADAQLYDALRALGNALLPLKPPAEAFLKDRKSKEREKYIGLIHAGLRKMKRSGKYCFLAFSAISSRGTDGYFSLLGNLESLINQVDPNEPVSIPCVILRKEPNVAGALKMEMLLSKTDFYDVYLQFEETAQLYATPTPTNN